MDWLADLLIDSLTDEMDDLQFADQPTDWLIDGPAKCVADLLTDWLAGLLTGWLAEWLTRWLTQWLAKWLTFLTDWLIVSNWLTEWLTCQMPALFNTCNYKHNWLADMLREWLIDELSDSLTDWQTGLLTDWSIDWLIGAAVWTWSSDTICFEQAVPHW